MHLLFAPGQDFVGIGLVAYIPDDAIMGGVVDVVQGHCQFNHAQPSTEMPPRLPHAIQQVGPQLIRQLLQLRDVQIVQRSALVDSVEQGGIGRRNGQVLWT